MLNDSMKLEEAKLKKGYVVQVIVNLPPPPTTPALDRAQNLGPDGD